MGDPLLLHFEDSGEWHSLPEWAEYFIAVGRQLVAEQPAGQRTTTALVVPTRAYAAAFVGLGIVIGDAAKRDRPTEASHFERLFDLAPGTPVLYRPRKGKILRGILQRPAEQNGKLWIKVKVHSDDSGGLTHFVDENHALAVQPSGGTAWKLPKKQKSAGKRAANSFVDSILGDSDPVQLGLSSKVVCALVGRRNALEAEIRQTPLSIKVNGSEYTEGSLQDVLRVDSFAAPHQKHRTALVASAPTQEALKNVSVGVVFDGAAGYLKWNTLWRGQHQVIVLDRTEPYFDDAIHAVNTRFAQCPARLKGVLPEGTTPPGTEVLSFGEVTT